MVQVRKTITIEVFEMTKSKNYGKSHLFDIVEVFLKNCENPNIKSLIQHKYEIKQTFTTQDGEHWKWSQGLACRQPTGNFQWNQNSYFNPQIIQWDASNILYY